MYRPRFSEEVRRWGILIVFLYLVLLLASNFFIHDRERGRENAHKDRKKVLVDNQRLAYLEWGGNNADLPPLILIHGSPGRGARDWYRLAPELAASGRRVIALDRWGYGASERRVDDYSFYADRLAVLELMNKLGIKQAHVAGWSYGGGPAVLLGENRDRILSVTLIASLGIQEGEGSGSFLVEHWKYSMLHYLANYGTELLPHFGSLGSRDDRYAFTRDFSDMDQRPIGSSISTMETPLLIVHGKNDPLVAAWVAQRHHELNTRSRLVLLDSDHFFPFRGPDDESFRIARDEVLEFLAAVEAGKEGERHGVRNETSREDMRALWNGGLPVRGYKLWFYVLLGGLPIGFLLPRSGGLIAGVAGGVLLVDPVTAVAGVLAGALIKRGESETRVHKALLVIFLGVIGSVLGAFLLPWL